MENILKQQYEKSRNKSVFKFDVCKICGWKAEATFYRKLTGKIPLRLLEIEAISKINEKRS